DVRILKVEFIGKGTFGKVAKCKDLLTNKEVAIKFIKKNLEEDGEDEIKALIEVSKIDAERYNLVKFVEWFHYNGHFCIVFEMLDKSLYNIMRGRDFRPLSLKEIKAIARQLLVALKGLKKINMVHCDIKLDNIMLKDHASESFRLKLIDFGFAKKAEDLETGATIQNLIFRAPEVILGLPLDERVDLWAVGYILAFLYTGFPIHPKDSEYNIIKFVENRRVVWKLDTPEQQTRKTWEYVEDDHYSLSFDKLKDFYSDKTQAKEVEKFIDLLKQMLEIDPKKRISINRALRHPFFNLRKKQRKTTKPQEPGDSNLKHLFTEYNYSSQKESPVSQPGA
uniref:Protein kinase domain-containing protein n=1 Tax=Oryzias melastigma TaxID=30732 RepID=A0A3B3DNS8_ORYME